MKLIIITPNDSGQRLDKFLTKLLNKAPKNFIYKMLRKKNIKLNNIRADGSEKLSDGDSIQIYLADETYDKFAEQDEGNETTVPDDILEQFTSWVIYEDDNIILLNKPAGILSQRADLKDISLVEMLKAYVDKNDCKNAGVGFKPAICNRLDRNTSGIVIAGKSLLGLQTMAELLKTRNIDKYYRCLVQGRLRNKERLDGYLSKDEDTNTVTVYDEIPETDEFDTREFDRIITEYTPVKQYGAYTLIEVKLVTGKSHQIRAHLASIGHAIVGDSKYGEREGNRLFKERFNLSIQLLHCCRIVFPDMTGQFEKLSGRVFKAELPDNFAFILNAIENDEDFGG